MSEKILFVDDEQNVLDGIRRQLRKRFDIETACGPETGLQTVEKKGPFAVIVSDMKMPKMNGAEFLSRVRELCPDGVRLILSGQSELDSAIAAVNEGNIFRFLTKPCSPEVLTQTIESGLAQYRLVTAEREVLHETLGGAVKILTEVLSLVDPDSFSRTERIRRYTETVCRQMGLENRWEIRLAAMVSQLGCISLPPEVLQHAYSDTGMSDDEHEMFLSHPEVAARLLANIPRLQPVSEIVAGALRPFESATHSSASEDGGIEALGAQILYACIEFDRSTAMGHSRQEVHRHLRAVSGSLAPQILDAVESLEVVKDDMSVKSVFAGELRLNMILDQDVTTTDGRLLVKKGQEVTEAMLARLHNFASQGKLVEPMRALVSSPGREAATVA